MQRSIQAALAAALVACAAAPAVANSPAPVRRERLSLEHVDLTSQREVAAVRTRIRAAANRVCAQQAPRGFTTVGADARCRATAMRKAEVQLKLAIRSARGNMQLASR